MSSSFKERIPSLERRKEQAKRIREKYPDRIPIIVERRNPREISSASGGFRTWISSYWIKSQEGEEKTKNKDKDPPISSPKFIKYLVSNDMSLRQFLFLVRKKEKLKQEESIVFYGLNNRILSGVSLDVTVAQLYKEERDEDDFLYLCYTPENTFGCNRVSRKK